jgi:PhnB protein
MKAHVYLLFNGNCEAAFRAYADVLNGRIATLAKFSEMPGDPVPPEYRDRIMHAHLIAGDAELLGSDCPPGLFQPSLGFAVSITVDSVAEADRIFAALSDGASITMPIAATFWSPRFGMLTDRFGIPWMIGCAPAA